MTAGLRKLMLAAATTTAIAGMAGMGHNMPPGPVPVPMHDQMQEAARIRRRENKKRWQKMRRRLKRRTRFSADTRFARKTRKHGLGYKAGKLFKGHRI